MCTISTSYSHLSQQQLYKENQNGYYVVMGKILFFNTTLLFVPFLVNAQDATYWADPFLVAISGLLPQLLSLFVAITVLVFVWGLVVFIRNSDDEKKVAEGKRFMLWGLVALFVMVGVWGIIELLQSITGIGVSPAETVPTVTNPL
jgi:hypothetical protein